MVIGAAATKYYYHERIFKSDATIPISAVEVIIHEIKEGLGKSSSIDAIVDRVASNLVAKVEKGAMEVVINKIMEFLGEVSSVDIGKESPNVADISCDSDHTVYQEVEGHSTRIGSEDTVEYSYSLLDMANMSSKDEAAAYQVIPELGGIIEDSF